MLSVRDVVKSYDSGFTLTVPAMAIARGTVTALLGANGSGKSTLLAVLAGILAADRGAVLMGAMAIGTRAPAPLAWRRAVTLVAQKPYLFRGTVGENVAYGLRLRGASRVRREHAARGILGEVGLDEFWSRGVSELSGGEAQMVALARALALQPRVLLLDEPTAHIDRENAGRLERVIGSLRGKRDLTVLMATHDHEQASRLSDRVISLVGEGLQRRNAMLHGA